VRNLRQVEGGLPEIQDLQNMLQDTGERRKITGSKKGKLVRERQYTAAAFVTSRGDTGVNGQFAEPASDLTLSRFLQSLMAYVSGYAST
jgi:hypothetical protein